MSFKQKLTLKAVSLAEVLVVLAIAATTLVSISQLTVQMLVTVKNNEINDYTTGIALQVLEIIKTADDLQLGTVSEGGQAPTNGSETPTPYYSPYGSYKLDFQSSPPKLVQLSANYQNPNATPAITECTAASEYYVRIDAQSVGGLSPIVCMQVVVKPGNSKLGEAYYVMDVVTITQLGSNRSQETITGYRKVNAS